MKTRCLIVSALLYGCLVCLSCAGMKEFPVEPVEPVPVSRRIDAPGVKSSAQLGAFFLSQNPDADGALVRGLASYYVEECAAEGINSDVAFVQMCLETGFLRFGGLVTPDMHNYCGLGAIDASRPGERFPNERIGVRAHVQHLHAYGTTVPLKGALVDPRYKYVNPRGKAPDVWALAGTWAADGSYGTKLDALLGRLEFFY